jgi:prepilin-type processing-associated H-X9-DG protein
MHPRHNTPSGGRSCTKRSVTGFTVVELIAAVAVISMLVVLILPALAKAQTKMRSNRCLSNLQDLGTAVNLYLQDSNDKLPYAALRYSTGKEEHHLAWDDLMGPYLGIDLTVEQRNRDGASDGGSFKLLTCPQDTLPLRFNDNMPREEYRRSYAMPEHNLGLNTVAGREATAADWPPCPVNRTGIGIRLDGRPGYASGRWNHDDEPGSMKAPKWQAAFQAAMIMDAPNTLFLTEQFDGANHVGAWSGATISDISAHIGDKAVQAPQDRFNYLMVDGHVESLVPQDSYNRKRPGATTATPATAPAGIWTVWQDD